MDIMDQLLLARDIELKIEFEDLVRSRDAAFESIRTINRALADNRAESRRIFQERLLLASASTTSTPTRPSTRVTRSSSADPSPTSIPATARSRRVRFAEKLTSFYSSIPVQHYNIWKRIRTANSGENGGKRNFFYIFIIIFQQT